MHDLFAGFFITDLYGVEHSAKPPSLLQKPFKKVYIKCSNGKIITPLSHPERNQLDIVGFDASIKMIMTMSGGGQNHFYRLIAQYSSGERWSVLYDTDGNLLGGEWC